MHTTTRNLLITCAVLVLVACLCLSIVAIGGAGLFLYSRQVSPGVSNQTEITQEVIQLPTVVSTQVLKPTTVPTQETNPEATPTVSSSEISLDVARQMDDIQDQVIELRGLNPKNEVVRGLLTPEQLRQHVIDDFMRDYSPADAQQDTLINNAFGLLTPGFDLYNFQIDLYSEAIAGYYDNKTKEMYIVQGEGFHGPERLFYSHEYDHFLQDQTYDTQNGLGYNDENCKKDSERCAAVQALLEGDAYLLDSVWFSSFATDQDYKEMLQFYNNMSSPIFDSAPPFLKEDLLFAQIKGQEFVQFFHDQGGWSAVDNLYKNPPVTTEQILHPDRYPNDKPVSVDLPDFTTSLGDGWKEIDRGVVGEWDSYLILAFGIDPQTQLDTDKAKTAVEGWGGDTYLVYYQEELKQTVLMVRSVWDTQKDADEFAEAFREYGLARFGTPTVDQSNLITWDSSTGYVHFDQDSLTTTWIMAPSTEIAQSITNALP